MCRTTFCAAFSAFLILPMSAAFAQEQKLPEGAGKDIFVRTCSGCHGPQIVIGRGNTEDGWTQIVLNMIQRGAQGSEDDFAQIVQYLTTNFPVAGAKSTSAVSSSSASEQQVNVNKATAAQLKTGLELTDKEAQSIITYRDKNGLFKSIDDLKKVPNLDGSKVDAHKERVTF
jgi:competence protein ComEA